MEDDDNEGWDDDGPSGADEGDPSSEPFEETSERYNGPSGGGASDEVGVPFSVQLPY